jgi:UDP-N-acetylmuramoyl-tripeptide--D-alanyl-D-alanine ligase
VEEFGSDRARAFADNAALIAALAARTPAAVTLVKGSRSARMETVVAALCGDAEQGVH